ncbi:uncharacterized protein STEHIDRAFT_161633 [Stereum hirsutum FP-91666 SS1]|uniref:uncharacterized protein n=1 Tax=Stereum hirsutum (strain FP-91666) TaxID=721885 RepID=UPI0004449572|nr:uncharacterized protein STEHIDRAFT_161633 [Stereum hirsutum FP-91666 SS1]EIM81442.1 hypothetical protein STEHIDRAFT_161633 [Stereum hirsutum FP-91666 SS1]
MPVRFIGFLYRLPTISWEEFDQMWTNHGVMLSKLPGIKDGKVKYVQYHKNPALIPSLQPLAMISDCDGMAEFEAETMEDVMAVFSTEEFAKTIYPDEGRFLDRTKSIVMPLAPAA